MPESERRSPVQIIGLVVGLVLTVVILAIGVYFLGHRSIATLEYDGIYVHPESAHDNFDALNYLLRFYPDGTVIGITMIHQAEEEVDLDWLVPTSPAVGKGDYVLDGETISFSLTSVSGTVDYQGVVQTNQLLLSSQSQINGTEMTDSIYTYVPDEQVSSYPFADSTRRQN